MFAQHRLFLDDARHCADGVKHLTTAGDPELARKIAATPPGMAYWTATGPEGNLRTVRVLHGRGRLVGSCEKNEAFRKTQGERPLPHQAGLRRFTSARRRPLAGISGRSEGGAMGKRSNFERVPRDFTQRLQRRCFR